MTDYRAQELKQKQSAITKHLIRFATAEAIGFMAVIALWYFGSQSISFLVIGIISVVAFCGWFYLRPLLFEMKEYQKYQKQMRDSSSEDNG